MMVVLKKINGFYSIKFILWIIFYCYATFAAFMFQKVLLTLFPNLHGGTGLIQADSVFFHKIAITLAESIRLHGWGQLSQQLTDGATGNVYLLAVLYVIFGDDPSVVIPINAAVHATSGLFIFLIACLLWPGRVGVYSGIIAASLFVSFPSALNWYAQVHKDGFAILGMLIIFYSWLKGMRYSSRMRTVMLISIGTFVGVALVIFVRPYNVMMLALSGAVLGTISLFYYIFVKRTVKFVYLALILIFFLGLFGTVNHYMPKMWVIQKKDVLIDVIRREGIEWSWHQSRVIPESIDNIFENTALVRMINIYLTMKVKTNLVIDQDIRPNSAWSSLVYLPRAAFIGVFSPFPRMWFESPSITRLVSAVETAVWYLLVPGVFLAFCYRRSLALFLMTLNSVIFLTALGFTHPNVGTLYRFRYVYLFILMLIGLMGWMALMRDRYGEKIKEILTQKKAEDDQSSLDEPVQEAVLFQARSTVATAGFAVVLFTLLSNVLFVARDVVLARWFGLGNELDAFFIAMVIPMFLVTVLCIPIGTVMVPPLLELSKNGFREKAQQLVTVSSTMIFYSMLFLCLLLAVSASYYIPVVGWGFSAEKIAQSRNILIIVLPLLFFSGFVILGNSVLHSRQKYALPAIAQSVVPVLAILTLLLIAKQVGIYAMPLGMCIGQLVNMLIVAHYVRKEGYSLFPNVRLSTIRERIGKSSGELKGVLSQYSPLVFSALFVTLALPVNNTIAASLSPGSVSAFNLGMKFVIFFTGLVGIGISTVMLPYFSSLFSRNRIVDARRELSFFLFLATAIAIPLTLTVVLLTEPLINLIFSGGVFTTHDTVLVTRIMEYGIIQLPFFCTNMLFAKFANAKRKNALIMISSLAGLVINLILNFVFIRYMGVGGIALAMSLSVMFSTVLFIIAGHRYNDVNHADVIFIVLMWLLYLTTILCYHFSNLPGVVVATTLLTLTLGYHLHEFFWPKVKTRM